MTLSYVFKTNWEQVKLHFWEIYTIKAFCLFVCLVVFYREVFGQVIHYFQFQTYLCYTVFIPSASDKKANIWLRHFMGVTNKQPAETMNTNHWVIYPCITLILVNGYRLKLITETQSKHWARQKCCYTLGRTIHKIKTDSKKGGVGVIS